MADPLEDVRINLPLPIPSIHNVLTSITAVRLQLQLIGRKAHRRALAPAEFDARLRIVMTTLDKAATELRAVDLQSP